MKRCPQCEFIYEDDQSLCDMDGVLLVFDSRTLPNLPALAPVQVPLATSRPYWRHRTFPAMAALIFASVMSLIYFISTQRTMPSSAPVSGASVTAPPVNPIAPSALNQAQPSPAIEANAATASETPEAKPEPANKTVDTPAPAPAPAKKPSAKSAAITQTKPANEPKKEESKVGSILKKTGHILKKPFKL